MLDRGRVGPGESSAHAYHRSWPTYAPTPLREAPSAAERMGVASVLVKDESARLGLPSFKILGASWATHRALCARLGLELSDVPTLAALKRHLVGHELTLVAATDGNHGRAVARMAKVLDLKAHILVPSNIVPARVQAMRDEGAWVTTVAGGYDDAIGASVALDHGERLVISDTSWPGYTDVPRWVIDGYETLSQEIEEQLLEQRRPRPRLVAVQLGVGAFGASIARAFRDGGTRLLGVEPIRADCVLSSIEAGQRIEIAGPQNSIMAGLNCGTPSPVAWPDVSSGIDLFAAIADRDAEDAMRLLAADGITSGESGAAGLAGLTSFAEELGLTSSDHVLVVSTEGATDPVGYERIVGSTIRPMPPVPDWGKLPSEPWSLRPLY